MERHFLNIQNWDNISQFLDKPEQWSLKLCHILLQPLFGGLQTKIWGLYSILQPENSFEGCK